MLSVTMNFRPEMVVGWYHSHPGFGCWFSGTAAWKVQGGTRMKMGGDGFTVMFNCETCDLIWFYGFNSFTSFHDEQITNPETMVRNTYLGPIERVCCA